ncbi:MAG: hypothetical protein IPL35_08930 [Sphingobacteriales bacterium]|nr:hypothetical protein [Sphingobacteriales bacterium]
MSNESIEPVKSEEPVFNYDEKLVWQGNPSQNANMKIFVGCLLLSWLVFPVLYALWKWYELETTNYIITNERILIKSGIFFARYARAGVVSCKRLYSRRAF